MINDKHTMGIRRNDDVKYIGGGGNVQLTKNTRENIELGKYNRYGILVPHNNGNVKLTGVDGKQVSSPKSQK